VLTGGQVVRLTGEDSRLLMLVQTTSQLVVDNPDLSVALLNQVSL